MPRLAGITKTNKKKQYGGDDVMNDGKYVILGGIAGFGLYLGIIALIVIVIIKAAMWALGL